MRQHAVERTLRCLGRRRAGRATTVASRRRRRAVLPRAARTDAAPGVISIVNHEPDRGNAPRRIAGSSPPRTALDLPLPLGPTTAMNRPRVPLTPSRAISRSTSRSRPKKSTASTASKARRPLYGLPTAGSTIGAARARGVVAGQRLVAGPSPTRRRCRTRPVASTAVARSTTRATRSGSDRRSSSSSSVVPVSASATRTPRPCTSELGDTSASPDRDPEVRQVRVALAVEQHVVRLDVTVHDPRPVRGLQRVAELIDHRDRLGGGERAALEDGGQAPPRIRRVTR